MKPSENLAKIYIFDVLWHVNLSNQLLKTWMRREIRRIWRVKPWYDQIQLPRIEEFGKNWKVAKYEYPQYCNIKISVTFFSYKTSLETLLAQTGLFFCSGMRFIFGDRKEWHLPHPPDLSTKTWAFSPGKTTAFRFRPLRNFSTWKLGHVPMWIPNFLVKDLC